MPSPESKSRAADLNPVPRSAGSERSQAALVGAETLLLVLDSTATIVGCNDAVCKFSGLAWENVVGTAVAEFLGSSEVETAARSAVSQCGGTSWTGAAGLQMAGGTRREVHWRLDALAIESNTDCYAVLIGIGEDESRLPANRGVAEHEARLQAILDTAIDGIVTIDDCGTIQSLNKATEHIFGYSFDELIGQNVNTLMPHPYRLEHDRYIRNYLGTGRKKIIGIGREVEGRRKDGSTFPLDLAVSEFRAHGRSHFVGLMRDITARKQAEREARRHLDELAHASRLSALGEMATGIAHEVNQPLAAIVSYAQACLNMLASENSDPRLVREALEQIAVQGRRAGDIVHQLRQLVRKEPLERESMDINQSIRNVLTLFSHDLRSCGAVLDVELADDVPLITADRVQVEQVTFNLLRNALEAASQQEKTGPRVRVETTRTKEPGVLVCISDNGPGFEGEAAERFFETFYTTKPQGLGVGLSISRSIIESHGGILRAEPSPMGGLDVFFTLPGEISVAR